MATYEEELKRKMGHNVVRRPIPPRMGHNVVRRPIPSADSVGSSGPNSDASRGFLNGRIRGAMGLDRPQIKTVVPSPNSDASRRSLQGNIRGAMGMDRPMKKTNLTPNWGKKYTSDTPGPRIGSNIKTGLAGIMERAGAELRSIRDSPMAHMVGAGLDYAGQGYAMGAQGLGKAGEGVGHFTGVKPWENIGSDMDNYWGRRWGSNGEANASEGPPPVSDDIMNRLFSVDEEAGEAMKGPGAPGEMSIGGTSEFTPQPMLWKTQSESKPEGWDDVNRYLKIARAGHEETKEAFDKSENIHTIRGTEQGFWNPNTREEYGSRREALAGRRGRILAKDMLATEKETLDREQGSSQAANTAGMRYQALIDATNIDAKARTEAAKIAGLSGNSSDKGRYTMEQVGPLGNEESVGFDTATGTWGNDTPPEEIRNAMSTSIANDPVKAGADFANMPKVLQEWLLDSLSESELKELDKNKDASRKLLQKFYKEGSF